MDAFVQSLLERLPEEKRQGMLGLLNKAIEEVLCDEILCQLSPEIKKQLHHPDPRVSMEIRTALAKDVGVSFVSSSLPLPKKDGSAAHMILLQMSPRFYHAEALSIQGGLEGLYKSGMPKKCRDNVMDYYINLQNTEQEVQPLVKELGLLQGLYENFRLHVTVASEGGRKELSLPAPEFPAVEKKPGLLKRLFGKKQ